MIRRPPRSTLFPYTTLFRSAPLRERPEDFPELVAHFARQVAAQNGWKEKAFAQDAIAELRKYGWPGNVRDWKSTRLNSSHTVISYAVFCLKKKKQTENAL